MYRHPSGIGMRMQRCHEIGRMLGVAASLDVGGEATAIQRRGSQTADHVARDSLAQPDAGIASLRDYIDQAFFMMKVGLDQRRAPSERRDDLWQKVEHSWQGVLIRSTPRTGSSP
jgi:hypothetical protein